MNLTAPPEERLFEGPPPERTASTRRFALIVLFCFLAHGIAIFLFIRFSGLNSLTPAAEAIPVEIVMEPPPPPTEPSPPPSKPEQPAKQAALDEKEATEAPRASDQKVEKEVRVEAPQSTKPAAQPAEPERNLDKTMAAKAAEDWTQHPKDDRLDGEPLKAADTPRPEAPEQTKAEKAAPEPVKPQPDDPVAAALKYAPVGGGNAVATYLSTVYGLVTTRANLRQVAAGRPHRQGEVVFAVDYGGALVGTKLTKSSGLPALDAAAIAAIRAAAPFPLPPTGSGITLVFKY